MNLTESEIKPYNQRPQTTPGRYSLYNEAANKYAVTSGNLIIRLSLSNSASNYFDLSDASTVASDAVYLTASVSSAKCLSIIDQSFGIVDTDDCQPLYLYKLESDSSDYAMQSSIRALNGGEVFPTEKVEYINGNSAWGDQLTQIKTYSISTTGAQTLTNTQTLSYDSMGNPTSYLGSTLGWQGKQLATATKNGNNYGYFYDENGLRLRKTTNGVATNYYYNGSVLIGMTAGSTTQKFSYDSSGSVLSVDNSTNSGTTYTTYYYLRNGQGDIVKLIDGTGTAVVQYTYDSWGKQLSCTGSLSTTLGLNQPFRYRGYVYDTETGWYYLQSRYYNPEVGRFISADVYLSTGQGVLGNNAYAYCNNNPIRYYDSEGMYPADAEGNREDIPGTSTDYILQKLDHGLYNSTKKRLSSYIDVDDYTVTWTLVEYNREVDYDSIAEECLFADVGVLVTLAGVVVPALFVIGIGITIIGPVKAAATSKNSFVAIPESTYYLVSCERQIARSRKSHTERGV